MSKRAELNEYITYFHDPEVKSGHFTDKRLNSWRTKYCYKRRFSPEFAKKLLSIPEVISVGFADNKYMHSIWGVTINTTVPPSKIKLPLKLRRELGAFYEKAEKKIVEGEINFLKMKRRKLVEKLEDVTLELIKLLEKS